MKKLITLLLALAMVVSMAACAPAEGGEQGGEAAKGSVYWLNFKPESDEALQEIAKMYKEETGVEVKVVTAAAGTYNETLTAQMDKEGAPTLFVVGNQAAVETWGDYCLDLKDTDIAKELSTDAYMLYDADGKLCSLGYCYECYGIICNVELLEKAGYTVHLGGNIGNPLLCEADTMRVTDLTVLELSSFQLMTMTHSAHVAVITNLAPNHLDVHTDMEEYVASKENIFLHQWASDSVILNYDNALTRAEAEKVAQEYNDRQGYINRFNYYWAEEYR